MRVRPAGAHGHVAVTDLHICTCAHVHICNTVFFQIRSCPDARRLQTHTSANLHTWRIPSHLTTHNCAFAHTQMRTCRHANIHTLMDSHDHLRAFAHELSGRLLMCTFEFFHVCFFAHPHADIFRRCAHVHLCNSLRMRACAAQLHLSARLQLRTCSHERSGTCAHPLHICACARLPPLTDAAL